MASTFSNPTVHVLSANGTTAPANTSSDLLADIFSSPAPAAASAAGGNDLFGLTATTSPQAQPQNNGVQQSSGDAQQDLFKVCVSECWLFDMHQQWVYAANKLYVGCYALKWVRVARVPLDLVFYAYQISFNGFV